MSAKYIAIGRQRKEVECDSLTKAFHAAMTDKTWDREKFRVIDDDGNVVYNSEEDDPLEEWIDSNFRRFEHLKED